MRRILGFVFCSLILACVSEQSVRPFPVAESPNEAPGGLSGGQARIPDTENGQPGQWPQSGKKRMVDVIQLKSEAKELTNLSNELPAQMEQIGNGRLPKELIENLKKIEKLAKRIRGEVS
jgi:hypothetical protein